MKHEEWKEKRCNTWDFDCSECLKQECLNDPEYEAEE